MVAHDLIGKTIVRYVDFLGKYCKLSGLIVETEAYGYNDDPASHAYRRITKRNKIMFGDVGRIYIYLSYGNHYCFNIVAKNEGCTAGAVLIRSIQPLEGFNLMKIFRKTDNLFNLTAGPGKLTQALKISKNKNGLDVTNETNTSLYLEYTKQEDFINNEIDELSNEFYVQATNRIGISKALEKKWRFIMMSKKMIDNDDDTKGYVYVPSNFLSIKGQI